MNRIIVDQSKNELWNILGDEITFNIDSDTSILINDNHYKKYVFNVNKGKLNILSIFDKKSDVTFIFNNNSKVIFNNISYFSSNIKIEANLNKKLSSINIYNSVISEKTQKISEVVNHNDKNTISNVYNFGVTRNLGSIKFDVTSKVFNGNIGSILNQESKIISLNETNDNEINPILLIDEYDTEAKHSAFIGKFKDSNMFYLQSRGLNEDEAYNLLLNGFLVGVMDIAQDEKEMIKEKIKNDWR